MDKKIEPIFMDENFNPKRYVLREVVGRSEKSSMELLNRLEQQKMDADEMIQQVVNFNYKTFSTSLRQFRDIYTNFHDTQSKIEQMIVHVEKSHQLFSTKRPLKQVLSAQLETQRIVQCIDQIQYIYKASSNIREFLQQEHYRQAVEHYIRAQKLLNHLIQLEITTTSHLDLLDSKQVLYR